MARSVRARGAGVLRNPEHDPNRALRQRWRVSQASLARAWPKSGCIMIPANEAVISVAQNAAPKNRYRITRGRVCDRLSFNTRYKSGKL